MGLRYLGLRYLGLRWIRYQGTGLSNEVIHDKYPSITILWVISSRRMRWVGDVARMRERCIKGFGGETRGKGTT